MIKQHCSFQHRTANTHIYYSFLYHKPCFYFPVHLIIGTEILFFNINACFSDKLYKHIHNIIRTVSVFSGFISSKLFNYSQMYVTVSFSLLHMNKTPCLKPSSPKESLRHVYKTLFEYIPVFNRIRY